MPAIISKGSGYDNAWKDFYIAVGQPGAFSNDMVYENPPIALFNDYEIRIKHAPLAIMPKIKNVVVQSWKDEDGDDIWLPMTSGSTLGEYEPAITHESVSYTPTFVMFCPNNNEPVATRSVRALCQRIQGKWLKLWDEYTQIGYTGCILSEPDGDPRFKRRNFDFIEFNLTFIVNGPCIDTPFDGITDLQQG